MADSDTSETLLDLLVLWEEQRRRGLTPTPETLCPDDPSLRELLRQRIARRERMQAALKLPDDTLHYATVPATTVPVIEGYTIHETVGRGGMGVVYRATQQALHRTVALKMI